MLIEPSDREFWRVQKAMESARLGYYDMEIMNKLYGRTCKVLPHQKYALLTGEFRKGSGSRSHAEWVKGGVQKEWDPEVVRREAKVVHFSDDPLPKPWAIEKGQLEKFRPDCVGGVGWEEDCRERDVWMGFYEDFARRRKVCSGGD